MSSKLSERSSVPWFVFPGGVLPPLRPYPISILDLIVTPLGVVCALVDHAMAVYEQGEWSWHATPAGPFGSLFWYRDQLWAGGTWLSVFDHDHWVVATTQHPGMGTFVVDTTNRLWRSGRLNGLWRTNDGQTWEPVALPQENMVIAALAPDDDGTLWVGMQGNDPVYQWVANHWHP